MHFGIGDFHSAFGIFIWHLAFSFSSGIQQFHSSVLFALLFSDNRHNQFLTARSPICLMSGKLIFLALPVWQLDGPGAVLRWAARPPPAPPLPPPPPSPASSVISASTFSAARTLTGRERRHEVQTSSWIFGSPLKSFTLEILLR